MKIDRKEITKYFLMFVGIFFVLAVNFYVLFVNVRTNAIIGKEQEIYKAATEYNYFFVESVDAIKLSSEKIEAMLIAKRPLDEILSYLEKESSAYSKSINDNFTGFYGVFNGKYLDGVGWVPDDDYDPYERPWYIAAAEAEGDPTFVTPYVDSQTGTVMMSVSRMLSDNDSVVSMDVSLSGVQKRLEENTIDHEWKCGMILDSEGIVVAHSDVDELGKDYKKEKDSIGAVAFESMRNIKGNNCSFKYKGMNYLAFISEMNDDWKAVSVIRSRQILGSMTKILLIFLLTLVAIFSIIIIVLIKIRNRQQLAFETDNQLNALANIYSFIYLINMEDDSFFEMADSSREIKQLVGDSNKDAQYTLRSVMDTITDVRYKKTIFDFINFSTLVERLEDKVSITRDFVTNSNQRCRARFVPVEWNEDGTLKFVIWLVEIVEDRR